MGGQKLPGEMVLDWEFYMVTAYHSTIELPEFKSILCLNLDNVAYTI